jgi:hypothetical protein
MWKPHRVRAPDGQFLPAPEAQCCNPGTCHAPIFEGKCNQPWKFLAEQEGIVAT